MDGLYDMDNELWDSDFDPAMQEALKMTDSQDLDWPLLDRDFKSGVIYHDKLISDALFGQPIKTEHSYSLNSDGDSIPDSPRSHKIDDMDDDDEMLINTKLIPTKATTTKHLNNNETLHLNQNGSSIATSMKLNKTVNPLSVQSTHQLTTNGNILLTNGNTINHNNAMDGFQRLTFTTVAKHHHQHQHQHQQQHQQNSRQTNHILTNSIPMEMECYETDTMDSSLIKDEPLSPDSSCPPSPNASIASSSASIVDGHTLIVTQQPQHMHGNDSNGQTQFGTINVNLANVAAYTNADLVFEHNAKNGSLQLSPASQSLLKNQQIILNGTHQRIVVPKLNIRMDSHQQQTQGFGLPPTPPSSLSSDDSEDNQSAEISYASTQSLSQTETTANSSKTSQNCSSTSRGYNGSSSRQPIHTPLISNQPKGSTGQLELTEEEKRTLVAEGYPIPTRLPLTKSEEKSLKKIRRKIKNKISAQESRRKKKEYMDKLERQVEVLVSENTSYSKRIETLVETNANLMSQLAKLQALLDRQSKRS